MWICKNKAIRNILLAALVVAIACAAGCALKADEASPTQLTAFVTHEPAQTPEPTLEPVQTQEPTLEPEPEPTPEPKPLDGIVIGLDPGHQGKQNSEKEPESPGSDKMKMKVTSGTAGVSSGVDEHIVNLNVGLKLRDMLEEAGADVIMTRESADVDISNAERAVLFNATV